MKTLLTQKMTLLILMILMIKMVQRTKMLLMTKMSKQPQRISILLILTDQCRKDRRVIARIDQRLPGTGFPWSSSWPKTLIYGHTTMLSTSLLSPIDC